MEFSVREWMILIGVLLIVAVLLDGYRRVRSERRNRIRVTLTKQALHRAHAATSVEEAPPSTEPNPELPNGGARVIPKTPRQDLQLDQSVPVLMESVHIAPALDETPEPETEIQLTAIAETEVAAVDTTEAILPAPAAEESLAEVQNSAATQNPTTTQKVEPHFGDSSLTDTPVDEPAHAEDPAIHEPKLDPALKPTLKPTWSEPAAESSPEAACATVPPRRLNTDAMSDSRPNSAAQEVLIINVISKDKAGFKGQDVLQILLACDLRYGNMNIFHRYEKANGQGSVQFSVANLVEPGTFDLDRIESFSTPGLCFFLTLPGPDKSVNAFNYMVETAQVLAKNLLGELRDEAHSVMTQQTIEHYRQRIRDFERKQLTLHL